MEPALAGGLRIALQLEILESVPDEQAHALHLLPADARHGIEIDAKLVRMIEILGAYGVRMQFEAGEVREPDE